MGSSTRRIVLMVLLLAVLIALIVAGRRLKEEAPTETKTSIVEPIAPAGSIKSGARQPLGIYRKGAHTPVPRFVVAAARDASPPALNRPAARLAASSGDGPRNKLPDTPPNFKEMQAAARQRMDALHEKANHCLAGFSAADPVLQKGVMLGIELDGAGLQRVWIDDLVDIPSGPLRCLSDAVYQIDWSGISDKPLMLTVPERYEPDDAGAK
jgi:hypothetical protein